jgi:hypothetical protein
LRGQQQTEKAQIKGYDRSDEQDHAEEMQSFDGGKKPERFSNGGSDGGLFQPLAERQDVRGVYGAPRRERPSGSQILPRDM